MNNRASETYTRLSVRKERFALDGVFTIARGSRTAADVVVATLERGGRRGRGECLPYARYGESAESVLRVLESLVDDVADGLDRHALQRRLPAGAARNALDCAFWDLEAKLCGEPVWTLACLDEPGPVTTAFTLSLAEPYAMESAAREEAARPLLKVKLGGEGDLERLEAVRRGAPLSQLIVDANEGWSVADYRRLAPRLLDLGVVMIEQPLPAQADEALARLYRSLPVCADESAHDRASLAALVGRYDMINIKLDKTGGLTEALALREAARQAGLRIMIGSMVATSLSMAPAMLLAQGADIVDLDGPLLLAEDRDPSLRYRGSTVFPPEPALWG